MASALLHTDTPQRKDMENEITQHSSNLKKETLTNISPRERKLFDLIHKILEVYQLKTTVRVAGGWVRDKVI
jgi:hypothetical protein